MIIATIQYKTDVRKEIVLIGIPPMYAKCCDGSHLTQLGGPLRILPMKDTKTNANPAINPQKDFENSWSTISTTSPDVNSARKRRKIVCANNSAGLI